MKLIIIAALGRNNELGNNNDLLWHIKEDLNYFRTVTSGHDIVMGKNTFLSLPKMLPNRHHIIISTTMDNSDNNDVEVFRSVEEFLENYKSQDKDVYVIGGGSIYRQLLPYTDEMHLTHIDSSKEASVYFPVFDKSEFSEEEINSFEEPIKYKRILYKRKRK